MIVTKNISHQYKGSPKLFFPDLSVEREPLVVTGGSGKGKTTLLHLLGGLLPISEGEIVIGDVNIKDMPAKALDKFRGLNIGIVLQESHFVESLTVLENVELASWLPTSNKKPGFAKELLVTLGLESQMSKHPYRLSIGQQQRVSIARALINRPQLLLADEPTSSLDDENALVVSDLLAKLSSEFNASLIIVTHDHRLKNRFLNTIAL